MTKKYCCRRFLSWSVLFLKIIETKKMFRRPVAAGCLLLVIGGFSACDKERDPCLQPTSVYLRARSSRIVSDTTVTDSLLPSPRWIAIDTGVTLLFGERVSGFRLLLNPGSDSTRYVIQPDSSLFTFDTVTFYHSRRLQFLSNACGYTYYYTLNSVRTTFNNIDSVRIRNTDVNGDVNTPEHVQVFF